MRTFILPSTIASTSHVLIHRTVVGLNSALTDTGAARRLARDFEKENIELRAEMAELRVENKGLKAGESFERDGLDVRARAGLTRSF